MTANPSQSFSVSYDSTTKIISALVLFVIVVVAIVTESVIVGALGAAVIILSYSYSPQSYAVLERSIVVKRLIGTVRVSLDGVRQVSRAATEDLRGCLRLWGSGGLFGYYGLFRTSRLGQCTWYVTNRSHAVVVVTDAKTAVFSPDNVEGFLDAIHASVPVPKTAPGSLEAGSGRSYGSGSWIGKLVGVAAGILVLAVVMLALFYAPGPPSYTLTPEGLAIHDRFYPVTLNAGAVDVERVRIVDLNVDTGWRPTTRTNGFANSHYRSGWFRVANGQKVRMYRADSMRVILLPPKGDGTPVLIEVSQPERFIEELRRQWSRRL